MELHDMDDFVIVFSVQYYILENHALCFMHVYKYLLMGLSFLDHKIRLLLHTENVNCKTADHNGQAKLLTQSNCR